MSADVKPIVGDRVVGAAVVGGAWDVDLGLVLGTRDDRIEGDRDLADVLERAVRSGQEHLRRDKRAGTPETTVGLVEDDHPDIGVGVGGVFGSAGDRRDGLRRAEEQSDDKSDRGDEALHYARPEVLLDVPARFRTIRSSSNRFEVSLPVTTRHQRVAARSQRRRRP